MKLLVKDLFIIMTPIILLIQLILFKDVSYFMDTSLKKSKLIMVLNLLGTRLK